MLGDWHFYLMISVTMLLASAYCIVLAFTKREVHGSWRIGFFVRRFVVTQKEHPIVFGLFIAFCTILAAGSAVAAGIILHAHI
jgi:hypothetical protein